MDGTRQGVGITSKDSGPVRRVRSLRSYMLLYSAAFLLPCGLFFAWVVFAQIESSLAVSRQSSLTLARTAVAQYDEFLRDSENILQGLAKRPLIGALDPVRCDPMIHELLALHPLYSNIGVFNSQGYVVCSAASLPRGKPPFIGDTPFFKSAIKKAGLHVTEPIVSPITGDEIIMISYPLRNETGAVTGGVAMGIKLASFQRIMENIVLPPGLSLTLMSRDGVLLAQTPPNEQAIGRKVPDIARDESEGSIEARGIDGTVKWHGIARGRSGVWSVSVGMPREVIVAPVIQAMQKKIIAYAILSLVLCGITWKLTAWIDGFSAALETVAQAVEGGDWGQRFPEQGPAELRRAIAALNGMLEARGRMEQELATSCTKLQAVSKRLVEVQEDERRYLSIELHDRIGHNLTALSVNLGIIGATVPPDTRQGLSSRLSESHKIVQEMAVSVRTLIAEIRPPVLERHGVLAALRECGMQVQERTGLKILVSGDEPALRLTTMESCILFRIAQEAIHNVVKHAHADLASIALESSHTLVRLTISDDGAGFDSATQVQQEPSNHWGLIMMQERAELIGGSVVLESERGRGTTVTVELSRSA